MIHSRILSLRIVICLLAIATVARANEPSRPPNVIVILADDLGYTDVACFGSRYYETPNIDQMAREGIRLTAAYTCGPNCQPTRAALMSGQYGTRTGVYTVGSIDRFDWRSRPLRPVDNVEELPIDRVLLPKAIKSSGYATAMFGKWHLGNIGDYHPTRRGFDEGFVSAGKHFDFETIPRQDVPAGEYLADYLTQRAKDFIQRHRHVPFFLYLPHFGVHAPLQAKPELIKRFEAKPGAEGHRDPTYAAMIASVDESVGQIRQLIQELELTSNTLIIFTSDNGGAGGYHRQGIKTAKENTDNIPLRGGKGMLYEGGIRVPYIACWPGTIREGKESAEPINSVDLYPTLLEVTKTACPTGTHLDGSSYLQLLKGESAVGQRPPLYWHFPGYLGADDNTWRTTPAGAIRDGDWKLIEFFEDQRRELYNLREDLGENQNLAETHSEKRDALTKQLYAWRQETHALMPTKNTEQRKPRSARRQSSD